MTHKLARDALTALGFNDTEASLYCELLQAPATGYRLAQAVGKSPPNVYHALGSLAQKGAVLTDDGNGKVYRAVPVAELLETLDRRFDLRREEARAALNAIDAKTADDRIYHLKTSGQVQAAARRMIAETREILLFDLFPDVFELLRDDLRTAAASGVKVAGIVYAATEAEGVSAILSSGSPDLLERWPGHQLSLVADAREYLLALLSRDGKTVRHAVWSDGAYLSALQHNALASEIRLSALQPRATDALAGLALLRACPPGLRILIGEDGPSDQVEAGAA